MMVITLRTQRKEEGFSLAESVITAGMVALAMSLVFGALINVLHSFNDIRDRQVGQNETQLAVAEMSKRLSFAITARAGDIPFTEASATKLVFLSATNSEPDSDPVKVTYELKNKQLTEFLQYPSVDANDIVQYSATGTTRTLVHSFFNFCTPWVFHDAAGQPVPVASDGSYASSDVYKMKSVTLKACTDGFQNGYTQKVQMVNL
jgi:type II secretory pathway pseudopilin PulG